MKRIGAAMLTLPLMTGCVATKAPVANLHLQQRIKVVEGMTELPPPGQPGAPDTAPAAVTVSPGMQYLYGSGEAAAGSMQAYQALTAYLVARRYTRLAQQQQVVLAKGATLAAPRFEACGGKPPAVVLDIDETALLNVGYESDATERGQGYDDPRWLRWEATGANQTYAVPGALAAIGAARSAGITVIFNSNRAAANAAATIGALDHAGLGPVEHGSTLYLKGDGGGGSGKDGRRAMIAGKYCVVAMVGDQLGDFSDLFNDPALTPPARRAAVEAWPIAGMWGNGWFVLPNPVYGTALKGSFDEVFPVERRWHDTGAVPK